MSRRPRPVTLVLSALAMLAGAAAAPAAANVDQEPQSRTFVLVRTTDGPASFELIIDRQLSDDEPLGFDGQVSGLVRDGRLVRASGLLPATQQFNGGVTAKAAGQRVEVCEPLGGCIVNRTLASQSATFSRDEGGPDVDNVLFVTMQGPSEVRLKAQGWELREVPLDFRYVRVDQAQSSGVFTGVNSVLLFESATAAGGRGGSIAVGTPPCSAAGVGVGPAAVPKGAGTATLTGGRAPASLTCPANIGDEGITDIADGATNWSLEGPVVGESTGFNVPLFVIDLPPVACLQPTSDSPSGDCSA